MNEILSGKGTSCYKSPCGCFNSHGLSILSNDFGFQEHLAFQQAGNFPFLLV